MTAITSAVYLLACAFLTHAALNKSGAAKNDGVSKFLSCFVVFFAFFMGGFFVLGYLNLATQLPAVNSTWALLLALAALAWFKPSLPGDFPKLALSIPPMQPVGGIAWWVLLSSLAIFGLMTLMLLAGFPRGYEAQGYHLPIALHISQSQSLDIWDRVYFHNYPWNASLYYGFLLGLFSEHLVAAGSVLFLIPLLVAVFGIGRLTGADWAACMLAACGLLSIPLIALGALATAADVPALAFVSISVYFALRSPLERLDIVFCGLAAGLAFGFKSLHLVSIAFIFVLITCRTVLKLHATSGRKSAALYPLLIYTTAFFAMAGFWLVRNYVRLGNPVYPVFLPFMGWLGWKPAFDLNITNQQATQFEWVRAASEWSIYPWVEWNFNAQNFKPSSGLGAFVAATVPVACLASLTKVFKGKQKERFVVAALFAGGLFILSVWWLIGDREPRYAMGSLVFLIPLVAMTIHVARGWPRRLFESTVGFCILSMLLIFLSMELVEFGGRFVYGQQFTRNRYYRYPTEIDHLPAGSVIVNLGHRTWNYALFGKNHQNRIVNHRKAQLAFRFQADGPDEPAKAVQLLSSKLQELGATHVFTEGSPKLDMEPALQLRAIARLEQNQFGNLLAKPLTLFEVSYSNPPRSSNSCR